MVTHLVTFITLIINFSLIETQKSVTLTHLIFSKILVFRGKSSRLFIKGTNYLLNLFTFYHHENRPLISDKALIINEYDGSKIVLEKPLKSIIKKQDVKPLTAVAKVKKLFDSLDLPKETIFRISRAVDLHSVALETNEIDNKLLSLWTAIETLIQKDVSSGKDRIIQIIDGITPFESNNYFNRILSQIKSDFWHYDEKLSKDIFNRIKIDKK
ncbi:hypothetical protein [Gracilimonas halophila]|uniref:Uncharacterized protein n=1 Tax=Gracilimonas halophila TaxID=1834464 RepID=A0ABW5JMP5_9BACT